MYIRRTSIKSRKDGSQYYTYRLVESERTGKGVRQRTLINLGTAFSLPREQWSELASRIEEIIHGQTPLFETSKKIEEMAQRYASQIIQSRSKDSTEDKEPYYEEVDVNSLEMVRPRSVSCEHVALDAFNSLKLGEHLEYPGIHRSSNCGRNGNHYWAYVPTCKRAGNTLLASEYIGIGRAYRF